MGRTAPPEPEIGADIDTTTTTAAVEGERNSESFVRRKARRGIRHAAAFLSVGLLLEVAATLWAAAQAVSSGAFQEGSCDIKPYLHQQVQQNCDWVELSEVLMSNGSLVISTNPWLPPHNLTGCTSPDELPLPPQNCECDFVTFGDPCFWTAIISIDEYYDNGSCFAYPVEEYRVENVSDSEVAGITLSSGATAICERLSPEGFGKIVIAMLVTSLGLELLEAFLGYKYLTNPLGRMHLMAIGSVVEAMAIATVLLLLRYADYGIDADEVIGDNLSRLQDNMEAVLGLTFLGGVSEVAFVFSGAVADRLPYLGAFGNGLIWLCAAWVEVLVTVYLALRLQVSGEDEDIGSLVGGEIVALVVVEVLALMVVWAYRVLMVRVKMTLRAMQYPGMQDFGGINDIRGPTQEVQGPVRFVS